MTLPPELARWRKVTRQTLLARRLAAPAADHARWSAAIDEWLRAGFDALGGMTVGFCWPYQAEFDARPFVDHLLARGARAALPAVVAKGAPLEFREWRPGVEMAAGVYALPVPQGTALLLPDALLIPVVGIGEHGDRLGYGGGFFDRTLAIHARGAFLAGAPDGRIVSTYWPGFALLLVPFSALRVPWLLNPLLGGATLVALCGFNSRLIHP